MTNHTLGVNLRLTKAKTKKIKTTGKPYIVFTDKQVLSTCILEQKDCKQISLVKDQIELVTNDKTVYKVSGIIYWFHN